MAVVTMKNLLESGVHFGHHTKSWNPKMDKFIYTERNNIHIIDLQKTMMSIKDAYDAVRKTVLEGKQVLFVGTKNQAQEAIEVEAKRCGMHYVSNRWLGGMLTNFETIKKSIYRLKKIEKMEVDGTYDSLTKKEISKFNKEKAKLEKNLGGIKEMKELPGIVFIIDTNKESIAVAEALKCKIPIVAVVDTNCNPDGIDYPIPGNDDARRAISLFTSVIANAVIEADNEVGLQIIENIQEDDVITDEDIFKGAEEKAAAMKEAEEAEELKKHKKSKKSEEVSKKEEVEEKKEEVMEEKSNAPKSESSYAVKPAEVKKLREMTGAGMLDCKNALIEANGDMNEAQKILKKAGLAAAGKREGRSTNEGSIFIANKDNKASICELTCETYFVAKNDVFQKNGDELADLIIDENVEEANDAINEKVKSGIAIIKENMTLKRFKLFTLNEGEKAFGYLHDGGAIGALAIVKSEDASKINEAKFDELGNDIALHIAAFGPIAIDKDGVDKKYLADQEEVFLDQTMKLGKPENIAKGIVQGKMNKHLSEICLVDQKFVKDDSKKVSQVIEDVAKELGTKISVTNYAYYKVGIE